MNRLSDYNSIDVLVYLIWISAFARMTNDKAFQANYLLRESNIILRSCIIAMAAAAT